MLALGIKGSKKKRKKMAYLRLDSKTDGIDGEPQGGAKISEIWVREGGKCKPSNEGRRPISVK